MQIICVYLLKIIQMLKKYLKFLKNKIVIKYNLPDPFRDCILFTLSNLKDAKKIFNIFIKEYKKFKVIRVCNFKKLMKNIYEIKIQEPELLNEIGTLISNLTEMLNLNGKWNHFEFKDIELKKCKRRN